MIGDGSPAPLSKRIDGPRLGFGPSKKFGSASSRGEKLARSKNNMKKKLRRPHLTIAKTLVLCTFAPSLLGVRAAALDSLESSVAEQERRRHDNELTYTQIDVPSATLTAIGTNNDRGQIVGAFIDVGGAAACAFFFIRLMPAIILETSTPGWGSYKGCAGCTFRD